MAGVLVGEEWVFGWGGKLGEASHLTHNSFKNPTPALTAALSPWMKVKGMRAKRAEAREVGEGWAEGALTGPHNAKGKVRTSV